MRFRYHHGVDYVIELFFFKQSGQKMSHLNFIKTLDNKVSEERLEIIIERLEELGVLYNKQEYKSGTNLIVDLGAAKNDDTATTDDSHRARRLRTGAPLLGRWERWARRARPIAACCEP